MFGSAFDNAFIIIVVRYYYKYKTKIKAGVISLFLGNRLAYS